MGRHVRVRVRVCTRIHACIHACTRVRLYTRVRAQARACVRVCVSSLHGFFPSPSTPVDSPVTFCPSYVWEPECQDNKPSRTGSRTKTRYGPREETERQESEGDACSGEISTVSGSEHHHNGDPRPTTQQLRDLTSLGHGSLNIEGLKTAISAG